MEKEQRLEVSYEPIPDKWWPDAKIIALHGSWVIFTRGNRPKPLVRKVKEVKFRGADEEQILKMEDWIKSVRENISTQISWQPSSKVLREIYALMLSGKIKTPSS